MSDSHRSLLTLAAVATLTTLAATPAAGADSEAETTVNAFSGSLTSSIPIGVPAFRGLEPKLALRYDSSGGTGFVGVGWSLSGVSVIERASPGGGAPRYDATDVYRLDGNVLFPCAQAAASPSCTAGGTHATRVESYAKINYDGTANTWSVWQRDGTKATYAARTITGRSDFRWTLGSVTDTKGNTVTYGWWCDGTSECHLDTVSYNGAVVKLWREARTDVITYATGAGLAQTSHRLKTIDVTVSGQAVRAYALTYLMSSSGQSVLHTVTQHGRNRFLDPLGRVVSFSGLPPLELTASTGTGAFGAAIALAAYEATSDRWVGDFNGDGRKDVLFISSGRWKVMLGTGSGLAAAADWGTGGELVDGPCGPELSEMFRQVNRVALGDVDGDGRTDLVLANHYLGRVWVARSTGATFQPPEPWLTVTAGSCVLPTDSVQAMKLLAADLDGDGKADIVVVNAAAAPLVRWYTGFKSTGSTFTPYGTTVATFGSSDNASLADVNGDGRADLVPWRNEFTFTYLHARLSTGTGFASTTFAGAPDCNVGWVRYVDVNGDGIADALCRDSSGTVRLALSTGSSWSTQSWAGTITPADWAGVQVADVTGDGRPDIIYPAGGTFYVMPGTGRGFGSAVAWGTYGSVKSWSELLVVDYTGDRVADLVYAGGASPYSYYGLPSLAGPPLVSGIANGLGGTTTITYTPSSTWTNTYLPTGMVFQTVASVTVSDGRGDSQATSYTYQGARWRDATAADPVREFLGFRKATTTLAATGAYSDAYYWQRAGTIAKPEVIYKRRPDGAIMSFDTFVFTENATPPYTSLATEAWSYECNGDGVVDANHDYVSGCRRVLATYAWDQYANLTTEYQYGDYDATGDERTAVRSFAPNPTAYVVGLPAYEEMRAGLGTGGTLLSRTRFYYDGATSEATAPTEGKLTKKGVWLDQTGGYLEHAFAYDAWGNQTAVTDPLGATVTKTYDATYHLLTLSTSNPLGHVQQTSWDPVLGAPLTQTDANGTVTTHAYDVFGRGTLTTSADGAQVKVEHLSYGMVGSQRIRTSKLLPGGVWVWDEDYFDGVGRSYKKVSSTGVTLDTIYGATGKVWKQSLPYVAGETVRYDVSTYDDMGRLLSTTSPAGAVLSQAYGDGSVTVTAPGGNARTSWFDAFRRVTKVREVIGGASHDTSFFYDRLGRRTKSVDAGGNQTAVSYDSAGRALQKSDPDQGLWSYGYDALGRITRETDALGKVTAVGYDVLGRATRRTYHDGTADAFTFDEAGRGAAVGRLTTAVSASGVTTRAFYDVMGRRTRYEEVLDGTTYALSHAYDVAGRLTAATYPDGEVVSYGYGTSGLATGKLVSVSGSVAGTVLSGVGYTAKGQIGSLTYGNGVTSTMSFDATGERVTSLAIGSLATISYGYDSLGQVTSMTAPTLLQSNWGYGYDSLGRLTSAVNPLDGSKSETFGYDALGRITTASKVGAYTYGSAAHVHAVTVAGSNTYAYDANGNLTSGGGRVLSYNLDHRPASIVYGGSTTSFVYDAQGVRVKKSGPAGTVRYVGGTYENRSGVVTRYYLAGGLRVAKRDANGNQYFHTDHLGSTRLITNANGAEVQRYEYAPYGAVINQSGTRPDSHRYTGQEADDETGLLFYQARYYDPALGRFLQPDSLLPSASNPQELDVYAYANNSPINYVDPSGHAPVAVALVCVGAGVAAAVGLISSTVAILIIGTALTFTNNPILQSIGMVMAGWAGATIFGGPTLGGLTAGQTGALVALAQSPISPLDPTIKKAIGWAYTVAGFVKSIVHGKTLDLGTGNALAEAKFFGKTPGEWYARPGAGTLWNASALWTSFKDGVVFTAVGWVAAYVSSTWSSGGRYAVAFLGRTMILGTNGATGLLGALGATYDLAYTLKYPDGRVIDLSGGAGGEAFSFYYHTGFEANFSFGRQHIRVGDGGGYWELGDARAGFFGPGLGWGGWVTTQKITVILSPAQAVAFRGALQQGAQSGGRYQGYHADSYTYISAALQFATGTSAADLHINPGLLHW